MKKNKQTDFKKRSEAFISDLTALLGKHNVGLKAVAFIQENGTVAAKVQVVDVTETENEKNK